MIAVVKLDDPRFGSGPGTVLDVVEDQPVGEVIKRYEDRDGARDPRLRFWSCDTSCKAGDRVEAARLVPGTGRWDGAP